MLKRRKKKKMEKYVCLLEQKMPYYSKAFFDFLNFLA